MEVKVKEIFKENFFCLKIYYGELLMYKTVKCLAMIGGKKKKKCK